MPRGGFAVGKFFAGEGLWLRNFALEGFAAHFIAAKWAFGLRNGTRVPGGSFAATKFFAGGFLWLRNCFVGGPSFHSITLFSQDGFLGCEILLLGKTFFVG